MNNAQRRGRLTLLAISALFITPIILAVYLYFSDNGWRPAQYTQHGDLITPPIGLPDIVLSPTSGDYRLREVWSLMVLANDQCNDDCISALEHIRQIRLSLGPKMTRLQTIFVPGDSNTTDLLNRGEFPVLIFAEPDASEAIRQHIGTWNDAQIFLVDPLGNLFMSYPPGTEMGDVRKDLGHLLKLSGIG